MALDPRAMAVSSSIRSTYNGERARIGSLCASMSSRPKPTALSEGFRVEGLMNELFPREEEEISECQTTRRGKKDDGNFRGTRSYRLLSHIIKISRGAGQRVRYRGRG